MGASQLLTLVGLNLLGMLTPGPDIFLITRLATRSRRHALAAVLGIATGLLVWVSLTVMGAAALLTAYPALLGGIQLLGGGWIAYMGVRMLQAARAQWGQPVAGANARDFLGTPADCYRHGLLTNLSNPKVVIYFSAIIAPLLPPSPGLGVAATVVAALVLSNVAGFGLLSLSISSERVRSRFLAKTSWIDLGAGLFFLVAGAALVVSGISALV